MSVKVLELVCVAIVLCACSGGGTDDGTTNPDGLGGMGGSGPTSSSGPSASGGAPSPAGGGAGSTGGASGECIEGTEEKIPWIGIRACPGVDLTAFEHLGEKVSMRNMEIPLAEVGKTYAFSLNITITSGVYEFWTTGEQCGPPAEMVASGTVQGTETVCFEFTLTQPHTELVLISSINEGNAAFFGPMPVYCEGGSCPL